MIERNIPEDQLPPAPNIDVPLRWIWRAWHRLHHDRPWLGGGLGPMSPGNIPWMVARAYAEANNLSQAEFHLLDRCFVAMDAVYRQWWADHNQPPPPPNKKPIRVV